MDSKSAHSSSLHLFEKFDVGVIHLDARRTVVAMNDFARKVLPVDEKQPFDQVVTSFHTERAKPKVKFLLDEASGCPMTNAVPMTMIINIPEQVLLIKVNRLADQKGNTTGFVLVFYDVTQVVTQDDDAVVKSQPHRRLTRIPMVANRKVAFVDTCDVLCLESQAHYTRILTREGYHFCNLSIGDLELRLDPEQFIRVHRRFIVNHQLVEALGREGGKTHVRLKGKPELPIPVSRSEVMRLRQVLGVRGRL
jgi:LytTR family transcriptional regulator, CO-responsive transcriptional regulator RcoM